MAAAVDSVAVVAVAPAESASAGKRLTPIALAKGCHENMAPFFLCTDLNAQCGIRLLNSLRLMLTLLDAAKCIHHFYRRPS